jgi:hypothetical protein
MDSYIICPKRDSKKVAMAVCLKPCEHQWTCNSFNMAVAGIKEEEPQKPVEEIKSTIPEKQSEDTDVEEKITEQVPVMPAHSKAEKLYKQVLVLKSEIETRWFELGKILQEIFEGKYYRDLGYTTWKEFCMVALGPLDLKWRAADYLRMTRKKCDEVGIGSKIAGEIGWGKLKEIVPIVTKVNKDQWIDFARKKETTVHTLWGKVQVALGKKTPKEIEVLTKKKIFHLFPEQEPIVELALEVAGRVSNSDKEGYLLSDIICPSFLSEYPVGAKVGSRPEIIVRLLGRFEAAFKVKFVGEVIDGETGEILVGARE